MIPLPIAGWSVLCSSGMGKASLAENVRRYLDGERIPTPDVTHMYAQPLPSTTAHAIVDFNVRDLLGRKGTSSLDRRSALAVVACGQAIEASDIRVDDTNRHRIGVVLGTSLGSLKSMNDYTQETLLHDRPYLVEPLLFPNTVMNCAAGQAAIRYGLKGVNATVAGCELAFLHALRYSRNALRCEYADALLMGAVEEFTPHTAWATHLLNDDGSKSPTGEGAAVFVTRRDGSTADRKRDGEILSVVTGYSPSGDGAAGVSKALEQSIRRAVHDADVALRDVTFVATSWDGSDEHEQIEAQTLISVFGSMEIQRIHVKEFLGDCGAATGALQLAALLALHHDNAALDERVSLLCGWLPDGGVGAAVFRGRHSCRP